jgi:hypothetical protein
VSLSLEQRLTLLKIVSDLEEGKIAIPRIGGDVGRFLRELGVLNARIEQLAPHAGNFVRGRDVGAVSLTPLAPLTERVETDFVGESASTLACSEELAGLVNVTLWTKARSANRLRTIWLQNPRSVRLTGDFRWFAPRRLTPGTASIDEPAGNLSIWSARCLKFVADEFLAAPPAISYRWDRFFGPADFRTFRVVPLMQGAEEWVIVPSRKDLLNHSIDVSRHCVAPDALKPASDLIIAMLARDPWDPRWRIVVSEPTDANGVLAHLITCADYRRELLGLASPGVDEVGALQLLLSNLGLATSRDEGLVRANLRRTVASAVSPLARWARGFA